MNKDKLTNRILQVIPGLLAWTVLTTPIWLGFTKPLIMIFFLTFLAFFWVYRAVIHSIGVYIGYKKYKEEIKIDWWEKCKELNFAKLPNPNQLPLNISKIKHLIVIPTVNEPMSVLRNTFEGIAKNNIPKNNLYVAVTCEERGAKEVKQRIEDIKKEFGKKIGKVFFFVHPAGIFGEAIGAAAANRTWGTKQAIKELKKRNENTKNFIFSTFDSDAKIHKRYLSRLTYAYLTAKDRKNRFYQTAVYLYDNNIWDVPPLMRIQANSVTLAIISSWIIEPARMETFSAYSTSLDTVIKVGYWDVTLGVDDTPFFWNAYVKLNGNYKGIGFFVPISSDAVQGKNFLDSHKSQYKQLVRWGWGVIVFPIAIKGFLKNKKIPVKERIFHTYYMLERYTIWRTITVLLTFGAITLYIVNPDAKSQSLAYSVPKITSAVLTFALIMLIPVSIFREKLVAKKPADWTWWKKAWTYIEGPLVLINLLTYSFIPYIYAETKFMFGKKMKDLYHVPKFRSNDN